MLELFGVAIAAIITIIWLRERRKLGAALKPCYGTRKPLRSPAWVMRVNGGGEVMPLRLNTHVPVIPLSSLMWTGQARRLNSFASAVVAPTAPNSRYEPCRHW